GFFVPGDAKGLAKVHSAKGKELIIATQNQDSLLVFSQNTDHGGEDQQWISLNPDDHCAEIVYQDNSKKRIEFYYGSTFLSQSSRKMKLDNDATSILITNFAGKQREVIDEFP